MNIKQFKKKLIWSMTQPELFLLPASDESYGPPLIYKVKQKEVYLQISNQYTSFELLDEDVIIDGENLGKRKLKMIYPIGLLKGYIDWGDGAITDFLYDDLSQKQNIEINHSYSDLEPEHNISIYGIIPVIRLYDFPIEIIQWGNIHLKNIDQLVGFSNTGDTENSSKEFKIPDSPLTGVNEVVYINEMFYNCAIEQIPDNFFCNCHKLVAVRYCFDHCQNLTKLGHNLFKNLHFLTIMYLIAFSCEKLEIIGDSLFENCINLDGYLGSGFWWASWGDTEPYWGKNKQIAISCPISKIGSNTFKNCTSLQLLCSKENLIWPDGESGGYWVTRWANQLFDTSKIVEIGESTFENCINLKCLNELFRWSPPIKKLSNTTFKGCVNVISAAYMFANVDIDLEEGLFDDMKQLKNIPGMYYHAFVNILPKIPSKIKNLCRVLEGVCADDSLLNFAYEPRQKRVETGWRFYMEKQEYYLQDGTKLPDLSWNECYVTKQSYDFDSQHICTYENINKDNWTEYFRKRIIKSLDVTGIFELEDNCSATWAFQTYRYSLCCWDWYDNKEQGEKEIRKFSYAILTGECPVIWEKGLHTDDFYISLNSSVYGSIGLSNFDSIPIDERSIIGYKERYKGMSNTEMTRYLDQMRTISEKYNSNFDETI